MQLIKFASLGLHAEVKDLFESETDFFSLDLKLGKKVNEGKTKEVYELPDIPGCVLMQSKDQITAGNAARKDRMEGKAAISNTTTSCVFQLLQEAGKYFKSRIHACILQMLLQNSMICIRLSCLEALMGFLRVFSISF